MLRNVDDVAAGSLALSRANRVARSLGLAAVAQDDVLQVHAASVVPVGRGVAHAPERRGQELRADRPVVVELVEVRPEIVALEVREDVPHHERGAVRTLEGRVAAAVVDWR